MDLHNQASRIVAHPPNALIAGLRDRIVHGYFGLDLEIIWQIIHDDLAKLKVQLEKLA